MYQQFNAVVYCGGAPFEVQGSYTRYTDGGFDWEADRVLLDGTFEIWHGLRKEWQRNIEDQVERMIKERQI